MGRPRKGAPLSQTPRAIAARAARAGKSITAPDIADPDSEWGGELGVDDDIYVETPDKPPKEADVIQAYHCENCKSSVIEGDSRCPICEENLDWAGVRRGA